MPLRITDQDTDSDMFSASLSFHFRSFPFSELKFSVSFFFFFSLPVFLVNCSLRTKKYMNGIAAWEALFRSVLTIGYLPYARSLTFMYLFK